MIELVFSFILNTWGGLTVVQEWADDHLGGIHVLTDRINEEEQILCALERQGLLVYDGLWKEKESLSIPPECIKSGDKKIEPLAKLGFRSETISTTPNISSWDQRVDLRLKDRDTKTIFFRQDKQHIGIHSTTGWSMWVQRKTGDIRYELVDTDSTTHFRLKVRCNLNPVKGVVSDVTSVEALHVFQSGGKVQKAHILVGKKNEGFTQLVFSRDKENFRKISQSESKKGFTKSYSESWAQRVGEKELTRFSDISSKDYKDFLNQGLPLAFESVDPEQPVPETALFR